MKKYYILFFCMVLTVPLFWGINAWQSNQCGRIRNEIRRLERSQENWVRENRVVANEIVDLLAVERLENEAQKMGLHKVRPQDVMLIILGGKGREY